MTTTEDLPVGTIVRYWPGAREGEGEGRISRTLTTPWKLEYGSVVAVEGYPGAVPLTHVEPLSPAEILRAAATRLREAGPIFSREANEQVARGLDSCARQADGMEHAEDWDACDAPGAVQYALDAARAVLGQPADGGDRG